MKQSKIMLAFIATIFITWCVIGSIGWMLSDLSYKDCMRYPAMPYIMLMFGWIPAIIIGNDLNDKLN